MWWEKEVFYAIIFPPHENILAIFFRETGPELYIFMETAIVRDTSLVVGRQAIWEVAVFKG